MANENENVVLKYLDYEGLSTYDQSIKNWGNEKNEEIKIKQINGKSDGKTILVTPGGTTPATYYTAEEAAAYNEEHELQEGDSGYKLEGDLKTPRTTANTNIDVNIDGTTLVLDEQTGVISVSSAALTQYVGDIDAQNKYAINISEPDANNEKKVSLDINANSNAIEKTTTGLLSRVEVHKFADPSDFGSTVKDAYALTINGNVLTGQDNEQVIKIYKDSALLDIKLLHAVLASYYTAEEAAEFNAELTGALNSEDALTAEQALAYNTAITGAEKAEGNVLSAEEATLYNATLEGAKAEGDLKSEAVKPTYNKLSGWVDIASDLQSEATIALCYAYENTSGTIVVEAVPIGNYLRESEFKAGLQTNAAGEVSVKVTSEKVRIADTPQNVTPGSDSDTGLVPALTVSLGEGVKLNHIQDAIDYAAGDAKTTLTEVAADSAEAIAQAGGIPKVVVTKTTDPNDHHSNYTISGQDLASETALNAEVNRAGSAETAIDTVIGLTKSQNSEAREYVNTGNYIGQNGSTVKSDISALDTALKGVSDKVNSFTPITSQEIAALFA